MARKLGDYMKYSIYGAFEGISKSVEVKLTNS